MQQHLIVASFLWLSLSLAIGSNCGPQPSPRPGGAAPSYTDSLPPTWWEPSQQQCGVSIPYPYRNFSEAPPCPPKDGGEHLCTCYENDFSVCPWTDPFSECPKNATTGRYDSVREECYGAVGPRWGAILSTCDSIGPGGVHPLGAACLTNPFTQADVRYMASYQLRIDEKNPKTASKWVLRSDMSVNTDGSDGRLANLSNPRVKQPSVGAEWGAGYYFRGGLTSPGGLGPPGMLFVLSVDSLWNAAWFLVNQRTLDLGPEVSLPNCRLGDDPAKPIRPTNCWGDAPGAEAGELDLLETPFWDPQQRSDQGYRRMYVTTYESTGFCNPQRNSAYSQFNNGAGGHGTTSYFEDSLPPSPHVYAAVVDAAGVTIYRDPDWEGLSASAAARTLPLRPSSKPAYSAAPCSSDASSCVRFNPLCVTVPSNETTYKIVGSAANSRVVPCPDVSSFGMSPQCIKSSWWNLFADTGQWPGDISGGKPVVQDGLALTSWWGRTGPGSQTSSLSPLGHTWWECRQKKRASMMYAGVSNHLGLRNHMLVGHDMIHGTKGTVDMGEVVGAVSEAAADIRALRAEFGSFEVRELRKASRLV